MDDLAKRILSGIDAIEMTEEQEQDAYHRGLQRIGRSEPCFNHAEPVEG